MTEDDTKKRPREEENATEGVPPEETEKDIDAGESDAKKSKTITDDDNDPATDPAQETSAESPPAQVAAPAAADESETAAAEAESTTEKPVETDTTPTEESAAADPADSAADIATATEDALTTTAPASTDQETPPTKVVPTDATAPVPAPVETPAPAAAAAISGLPPVDPSVQASVINPNSVVEERGEVSSLYVGRVIGKGGEQIRDLQARSGCRIDVDQNVPPGHPRVITYRGTRKTVDFAKQLVHLLCQEHGKEQDLPLGEAAQKISIVPASSIGKIIGRGGEMIRELQSRSQAKIQIDHSGASGTDPQHRQVTLTGTQSAVTKAEEMIMFLVANPSMDAMQSITMLTEDKTQRGGVWGSGPPYPNLPNQGQNMVSGPGSYGGQPGGDPYSAYGQQAAAASSPHGAPPGGGGYGAVEMEIFPAAKIYMGRIIGQKGVTINDLQKRSGADIQINQDVPAGQDCQISIKGNRQAVDMVKQMLREIIEMGPNHPYAGGGGGQQGGGGYGNNGGGGGGGGGYPQQQYQQQGGYPPQGGSGYGGYQQPPAQQYYQQQPAYGQQQQQPYGGQPSYAQAPAPYGQAPAPSPQYPPQQHSYQQQAPYSGGGGGYPPQQQAPAAPAAPAASSWKTATAGDGQVYYYNEVSGETQWEKPAGML